MSDFDLRLGDWREVLADVGEVDALVFDPPYSKRTHDGHDQAVNDLLRAGSGDMRKQLSYAYLTDDDVRTMVEEWSPRTRGWFAVMSDHVLQRAWESELSAAGRYVFAPVPCVIPGMTVRMAGDGPSSWAVYLTVARPKTREWASWGALPGAYIAKRGSGGHIGGKPLDLMRAIVRDYSRPGDLVCDPCAGFATTGIAAEGLGRRFIGAEIDPETYAKAMARRSAGVQTEMFV